MVRKYYSKKYKSYKKRYYKRSGYRKLNRKVNSVLSKLDGEVKKIDQNGQITNLEFNPFNGAYVGNN